MEYEFFVDFQGNSEKLDPIYATIDGIEVKDIKIESFKKILDKTSVELYHKSDLYIVHPSRLFLHRPKVDLSKK